MSEACMRAALRIPGDLAFAEAPVPDACLSSAIRILSRYVSRPLDRFLAGFALTISEFQILVALKEGPARALVLSRRLRLDPGHIARALARLEGRELVRRAIPSRFTEWVLEPTGTIYLELLEPGWASLNDKIRWLLHGGEFPKTLVRIVDGLRYPLPKEHQGWSDD